MIDCKCSFSATLITEDFSCEHAQLVTRRAGPDIACASEHASEDCKSTYEKLKAVGLPAFDAEDDLLKTPASVFTKIQYGGLLGLSKLILASDDIPERIDNIFQLVGRVVEQPIEFAELANYMTSHKTKRKKRHKK